MGSLEGWGGGDLMPNLVSTVKMTPESVSGNTHCRRSVIPNPLIFGNGGYVLTLCRFHFTYRDSKEGGLP